MDAPSTHAHTNAITRDVEKHAIAPRNNQHKNGNKEKKNIYVNIMEAKCIHVLNIYRVWHYTIDHLEWKDLLGDEWGKGRSLDGV